MIGGCFFFHRIKLWYFFQPLDAAMKKDLEASLNSFVKKGESIQLTLKVDPSLIGGMVVSIGDRYIDMSMASKINRYTSLLQQAV